MKRHLLILTIALAVCLTACGQPPVENSEAQNVSAEITPDLRTDIAQMLLVGFRGTSVEKSQHIARDIKTFHIGGVILFDYDAITGKYGRNITSKEQVTQLCSQLQALNPKETLLISIDQEGGRVCRLKQKYGFPELPSAQWMGSHPDDSVRVVIDRMAETMHQCGINLDFAPCVDVNVNPQCPVIGKLDRSFSEQPDRVTECANIWLDVLQKNHVAGCLKHFPGHGSAKGDTHLGLVDVTPTWKDIELEPYRQLFAQNPVPMVMVAHVLLKSIDEQYPMSLSENCITALLRNELGYQGVVITDDLAMGAIAGQYGMEKALQLAILAGADILCLSNNGNGTYDPDLVPNTIDMVEKMVRDGLIPEERIHESAARIRQLKGLL